MRAIISVSDKTGVVQFARMLEILGYEIYSSGGTHRALQEAGIAVRSVSDLTGFPEMLDGRVKTLHPAVHAGILARRDVPEHGRQLAEAGFGFIDLVAVNLYPFVQTVTGGDVSLETALENIDIGGPTLIRAAAKNFPSVVVVVDPADYDTVIAQLHKGELGLDMRRRLAQKAFQHVASYDTAIAEYLRREEPGFPEQLTVALERKLALRYGENPHQEAAFYAERSVRSPGPRGVAAAEQLHGKELSYNNILDADAAWNAAIDFPEPTVVIVKHTNPCGLASREDLTEAFRLAFEGDPVSAFGGIVAVNRPVTRALAEAIRETRSPSSGQRLFLEIVVAPDYEPEALDVLRKSRDLRVLRIPATGAPAGLQYRSVSGGVLVQGFDTYPDERLELRTVTRRAPTPAELADLRFAWKAVKHVKSNAIVLVKDRALVGMGAGQPNRVTSVHLAARAAGDRAAGSVLASDAFFPFPDNVELAAEAGVTAIVEPGGSIRDDEVIRAADAHNLAMVFTGVRHFRH